MSLRNNDYSSGIKSSINTYEFKIGTSRTILVCCKKNKKIIIKKVNVKIGIQSIHRLCCNCFLFTLSWTRLHNLSRKTTLLGLRVYKPFSYETFFLIRLHTYMFRDVQKRSLWQSSKSFTKSHLSKTRVAKAGALVVVTCMYDLKLHKRKRLSYSPLRKTMVCREAPSRLCLPRDPLTTECLTPSSRDFGFAC